jgi:enterochelin esterase-like enzyme
MKNYLLILSVFLSQWATSQSMSTGHLERLHDLKTNKGYAVKTWVWTPEGYDPKVPCNVIYMYDGQMLFDADSTWNHLEWTMDETVDHLMKQSIIGPTIVVGISFSDSLRHSQYTPQKPFEQMDAAQQQQAFIAKRPSGNLYYLKPIVCSDDFLDFVVHQVKPHVDSHYTTLKDRAHTYVGGASMGGLMAMYSLLEYPEVFDSAFCLSTNWPLTEQASDPGFMDAWQKYVAGRLPHLTDHFIYMDYGGRGKDATYGTYQKSMDDFLRRQGFNQFETRSFPEHDHSEADWAKRIQEVLIRIFLQ